MLLDIRRDTGLPPLAWCAEIRLSDMHVMLKCGSMVENRDNIFTDGAWDGPFNEKGLHAATVRVGFSGRLSEKHIDFFCPTDTLHRLYVISKLRIIYVSNSLPFVLVESGERLSDQYYFYEDRFQSIVRGIQNCWRSVPTDNGHNIHLFYYNTFRIGPSGDMTQVRQVPPPKFAAYRDYEGFVENALKRIIENVTDHNRIARYTLSVGLSKGYDSVACAALVAHAGGKDAFSFFDSANRDDPQQDCGEGIAKQLGLTAHVYDRYAYRTRQDFPEAEFLACGTGGEDVFMVDALESLRGRLLVTGFHGDKIWAREGGISDGDIIRGDASGSDISEIRLRIGFINAPLPFWGAINGASVNKISNSQEMREWQVGGVYDRPIPRRIAEERGVNRKTFGQEKRVMSVAFNRERGHGYLSRNSEKSFNIYMQNSHSRTFVIGSYLHKFGAQVFGLILSDFSQFWNKKVYRIARLCDILRDIVLQKSARFDRKKYYMHWACAQITNKCRHSYVVDNELPSAAKKKA